MTDTMLPNVFGADEQRDVAVDVARWLRLARLVLADERVDERYGVDVEMSLLFVDESTIAELNERFLGAVGPTDVLAFPMDELDTARSPDEQEPGPTLLGDVVLCPEYARRGARAAGHSLAAELELLTVHGVLHLLGYDHAEPEEEREMFALQAELLESWRAGARAQ
jgi:probable rRNA maturation factor